MPELTRYTLCLFSYANVQAHTVEAVLMEMVAASSRPQPVAVHYLSMHDDALISRSRSKVASAFLDNPDSGEVLCMVDRDIEWRNGELTEMAEKALEERAIVGGLYSNRMLNAGFASRASKDQQVKLGSDVLLDAEYVATGFMAIPRCALQRMRSKLAPESNKVQLSGPAPTVDSGLKLTINCVYLDGSFFTDYFRPFVVPSTMVKGAMEYLSEDWAFCRRAKACGIPLYLSAKPLLRHWGPFPYTMATSQKKT